MATLNANFADDGVQSSVHGGVVTILREFELDNHDLATTPLAADDIIRMAKLPPAASITDAYIATDAAMALLAADVGLLNAAGDDTDQSMFAAQDLSAVGTVALPDAAKIGIVNEVNTGLGDDGDKWVALKLTAGTVATTGKIQLLLTYRNMSKGV